MRLFVLSVGALVALAGCAKPGLYQWGGYEQKLYASYKDPAQSEALRISLEKHISEMESSKLKVAPGLYAELGTLHLQSGASDKAVSQYTKELNAWPESKILMNALIQNIQRRIKEKQGAEK